MIKIAFLALVLVAPAYPAYGQTLEAKAVSEDLQEALLRIHETGEEVILRSGDSLEGWRIVKISRDSVTVARWGEDGTLLMTDLPMRRSGGIILSGH
jgi:type II secretory pathway component PulC